MEHIINQLKQQLVDAQDSRRSLRENVEDHKRLLERAELRIETNENRIKELRTAIARLEK